MKQTRGGSLSSFGATLLRSSLDNDIRTGGVCAGIEWLVLVEHLRGFLTIFGF